MSAIAEALVATAVGLVVAIPAVAMNNFYQRISQLDLGQHRRAEPRAVVLPGRCRSRACGPHRPLRAPRLPKPDKAKAKPSGAHVGAEDE